jgi:hypothetical protein
VFERGGLKVHRAGVVQAESEDNAAAAATSSS